MAPSPPPCEPPAGEAFYGLDDLLAAAGERLGEEITPRTVRLYATQGLIDRPGKEGRSAVYGPRHLLQLLLIRSLARRGLSLSAIAPLCVLPDAELEQQLAQLDASTPEAGPTPLMSQSNPAMAYLEDLRRDSSGPVIRSQLATNLSLDLSEALSQDLGDDSDPQDPPSPPSRSPSRSGSSRDAASRWHRFSLAPGVELHISESVSIPPPGSRRLSWLQRLADRLLEQLDDRPS